MDIAVCAISFHSIPGPGRGLMGPQLTCTNPYPARATSSSTPQLGVVDWTATRGISSRCSPPCRLRANSRKRLRLNSDSCLSAASSSRRRCKASANGCVSSSRASSCAEISAACLQQATSIFQLHQYSLTMPNPAQEIETCITLGREVLAPVSSSSSQEPHHREAEPHPASPPAACLLCRGGARRAHGRTQVVRSHAAAGLDSPH